MSGISSVICITPKQSQAMRSPTCAPAEANHLNELAPVAERPDGLCAHGVPRGVSPSQERVHRTLFNNGVQAAVLQG